MVSGGTKKDRLVIISKSLVNPTLVRSRKVGMLILENLGYIIQDSITPRDRRFGYMGNLFQNSGNYLQLLQ